MLELIPPVGAAPFRQFTLRSGRIYRPDFSKGGLVQTNEQDALELLREGWTRVTPENQTIASLKQSANEAATRRRRL